MSAKRSSEGVASSAVRRLMVTMPYSGGMVGLPPVGEIDLAGVGRFLMGLKGRLEEHAVECERNWRESAEVMGEIRAIGRFLERVERARVGTTRKAEVEGGAS